MIGMRIAQVLLAGLVPLGCAVAASTIWFPATTQRIDLAHGQRLFQRHCAGCHSLAPGGGGMGPSLADIGAVAAARVPQQSATDYLYHSIVDPDAFIAGDGITKMPGGFDTALSRRQLQHLVAFLAAQGGQPDYRQILQLPAAGGAEQQQPRLALDIERIDAGRRLFYGRYQCGQCHGTGEPVAGAKLLAPTLAGVGVRGGPALRQAIRNPSEQISPPYRQYQCLTVDGQVVVGRLLHQDDDQVTLLTSTADGSPRLVELDADELEITAGDQPLVALPVSPMPAWAEDQMPPEDLELLVEFLLTLR